MRQLSRQCTVKAISRQLGCSRFQTRKITAKSCDLKLGGGGGGGGGGGTGNDLKFESDYLLKSQCKQSRHRLTPMELTVQDPQCPSLSDVV